MRLPFVLVRSAAVIMLLGASVAKAQSVAFTFDDGPKLESTPRLGPLARNEAMLESLKRHRVRAALFVTLANGADRPEGLALARAWGEAGHFLGNHTVTHPDLNANEITLAKYTAEIRTCDQAIRPLPGFRPWFRFTFLREGNTPEKRDGMRTFLKEKGLQNAYVTLDTSDWRMDGVLKTVLNARPEADLTPIRKAYLAHVRQRAEAYRDLSRRLFGRDIPQVILLHHNLLNALFLDDVLNLFEGMGWTLTDPETAFRDFVYTLEPQRPAPGQSLLLSAARSLGYRVPEWERLVDDGDADVEALRAQGALKID
jgi:peptidoglycan/xylan/chitin deacetylase (PgdA/CDA1 family)